ESREMVERGDHGDLLAWTATLRGTAPREATAVCSLPPCGGGGGRGVATDSALAATALPAPPPQGGRGRCGTSLCTISGVPAELGQRNSAWASLTAASPNAARRCRRPCAGTRRGENPQSASSRQKPPAAGSAGSIPRGNGRLRRRRRPCARAPG